MVAASHPTLSSAEVGVLATASGIALQSYRAAHVAGCASRACVRLGVDDVGALADRLRRDAVARAAFRRAVLVGVTRMFRDEGEFELLERTWLPELLEGRERIDVWSAGCSNGDELRSVAVLLERLGALDGAHLLGSDVLEESLAAATAALASEPAATRAAVRFEHRDLIAEGPPARSFDLVLCRNVAIYLAKTEQRALHAKLVAALRTGGVLMLGRSETLFDPAALGLERIARHAFRKVAA